MNHAFPLSVIVRIWGCREHSLIALQQTGLSWLPLNALEGVFELAPDRLFARAEDTFSLAERFKVRQVILVPGKGRPSIADAGELLVELAKRGCEHGVNLLYEFIGFSMHAFPSLEEAHAVATAAGLPLVVDTFHLAVSRTNPERVAALPADAIGLVHLSGEESLMPIESFREKEDYHLQTT
jgi:sugar phosphate isomerase/epimerase